MHKARHIITEALFDGGHDNHFGNTMFDGKHYDIPWRIDNGDALQTNAQGEEKDSWRRSDKTQTILPGIYHAIRNGDLSAKEAFSQMQAIAQIWRRQKGAIEKLYACQEDPEQFKIFRQRVHSILTTLDICRSPLDLQKQIRRITSNLEQLENANVRQQWTEADRLKEPYDFKEGRTSGIMRRSFGGEMMTKPLVFRKARRRDALINVVNSLVFRTGLKKSYKTPAWQRAEGQNPKGGLNAKGRASAKAEGHNLKPPVKSGDNPRRASFLARMGNSPGPEYDEHGKPTRLLLSLQAWGASSKADARKKAKAISARLHASK